MTPLRSIETGPSKDGRGFPFGVVFGVLVVILILMLVVGMASTLMTYATTPISHALPENATLEYENDTGAYAYPTRVLRIDGCLYTEEWRRATWNMVGSPVCPVR